MNACVTGQFTAREMTEFYVKVQLGSSEFMIEEGSIPTIHVTSDAEKGKANTELLRQLERILGEKPGLVSGHMSSRKKLVVDMDRGKIMDKIREGKNG